MAVSTIDTTAVKVINNTDSELFFFDGNPNNWHSDNGSRHTLVIPGYGLLSFDDGKEFQSPGSKDPRDRIYWELYVTNGEQNTTIYHSIRRLIITVNEDASFKVTTEIDGFLNPLWTMSGTLQNGNSWLKQVAVPAGQALTVLYNTSLLPTYLTQGTSVELIVVHDSDDQLANPTPIMAAITLPNAQGSLVLTSWPDLLGTVIIKSRLGGKVLLSHGTIQLLPKPTPMPHTTHVHSIAVAADPVHKYHFFVALMSPRNRTLWHATTEGASLTWTELDNPTQPVSELEVLVGGDGIPMLFALDESGYVHTRHGDESWQNAPWAGQSVPFIQLTAVQADTHHIIALDVTGTWWRSELSSSWSNWAILPTPSIGGSSLLFQDIASAGSWLAGVDFQGRAYVDLGGQNWQTVTAAATGVSLPKFVAVELTLSHSGDITLWLIDEQGGLWSSIATKPQSVKSAVDAGYAPPVPLGRQICGTTYGTQTQIWVTSNLLDVWSLTQGENLWDGPTWGGMHASTAGRFFDLAACRFASGTIGLYVTAAGKDATHRQVWAGLHSVQTPAPTPEWQVWNLVTQPAPPPIQPPVDPAPVSQIAGVKGAAKWLWAVATDGKLYKAPISASSNLSSPVWELNSNAPNARTVAACNWSGGIEELWLINGQGQVLRATETDQFAQFTAVASVPLSRGISAVVVNNTTVLAGLNANRQPYDVTPASSGGGFQVRQPAFGVSSPTEPFFRLVVGSRTVNTAEAAVALGLDADGWLWVAEQSGDHQSWTGWTGPRAYSQPARFVLVEAANGYLLAADTLYRLWAYDFAASKWEGSGWQNSSSLPTRGLSQRETSLSATSMLQAGVSNFTDPTYSSTRTFTPLQIGDNNNLRAEYPFTMTKDMSLVVATIVASPSKRYSYAIRYGPKRGPGTEVYPNDADDDYYEKPDSNDRYLYALHPIGIPHPIRDTAKRTASRVRTVVGDFRVTVTDTTNPNVGQWSNVSAYLWQRNKPVIPSRMMITGRSLVLLVNVFIAWRGASDPPSDRTEFKNKVYSAKEDMTSCYANYGIQLLWTSGSQIPEIELENELTESFADGTPTYSFLKDHGRDDAANIVFTTRMTGNDHPHGITGARAALPLPDRFCFGVIVQEWVWPKIIAGWKKNANQLFVTAAHELGHLLGLSHNSALNRKKNLMIKGLDLDEKKRGEELDDEQLYIIKNAVLVQEQVTAVASTAAPKVTSLHVAVKTGEVTGGWFKDNGTDEMVRLLVINQQGEEFLTLLLDHALDDDFQVGDLNFFTIDLDEDRWRFVDRSVAKFGISYSDNSVFGDQWKAEQLTVTGYVGEKVCFVFNAATLPYTFRQRRESWSEDVTAQNTRFFDV